MIKCYYNYIPPFSQTPEREQCLSTDKTRATTEIVHEDCLCWTDGQFYVSFRALLLECFTSTISVFRVGLWLKNV